MNSFWTAKKITDEWSRLWCNHYSPDQNDFFKIYKCCFHIFCAAYFQISATKSVHFNYFFNNFYVYDQITIKFAEIIWLFIEIVLIKNELTDIIIRLSAEKGLGQIINLTLSSRNNKTYIDTNFVNSSYYSLWDQSSHTDG